MYSSLTTVSVESRWGWIRAVMVAVPIVIAVVNFSLSYLSTRRWVRKSLPTPAWIVRMLMVFLLSVAAWLVTYWLIGFPLGLGVAEAETGPGLDPESQSLFELWRVFSSTLGDGRYLLILLGADLVIGIVSVMLARRSVPTSQES